MEVSEVKVSGEESPCDVMGTIVFMQQQCLASYQLCDHNGVEDDGGIKWRLYRAPCGANNNL